MADGPTPLRLAADDERLHGLDAGLDVSVVVPCHNAADYLGQALASILAQTLPPVELIVVDDGSTDDSAAVALRSAPGAKVIRQEQQGIAGARNRGVSAASGAAVAFLDADDLWPPDSLLCRWRKLAADPALDGVYGDVTTFAEGPRAGGGGGLPAPQPGRLAGALLVRREAFIRVGPFDTRFRVGETLDWIARAEECRLRFEPVQALVLARRVHERNTVRDAARAHGDYLRVLHAAIARRRGMHEATAAEAAGGTKEAPC